MASEFCQHASQDAKIGWMGKRGDLRSDWDALVLLKTETWLQSHSCDLVRVWTGEGRRVWAGQLRVVTGAAVTSGWDFGKAPRGSTDGLSHSSPKNGAEIMPFSVDREPDGAPGSDSPGPLPVALSRPALTLAEPSPPPPFSAATSVTLSSSSEGQAEV